MIALILTCTYTLNVINRFEETFPREPTPVRQASRQASHRQPSPRKPSHRKPTARQDISMES
jgi:hypothetical protein